MPTRQVSVGCSRQPVSKCSEEGSFISANCHCWSWEELWKECPSDICQLYVSERKGAKLVHRQTIFFIQTKKTNDRILMGLHVYVFHFKAI